MPEDLRLLWPTLSPRERDALVAKAKGWTSFEREVGPPADTWRDENGVARSTWSCSRAENEDGYHASQRWSDAGPLLEEMLAANCEVRMQPATEKSVWADHGQPALLVAQKTAATIVATGASWPERIALAYCQWRGAQP